MYRVTFHNNRLIPVEYWILLSIYEGQGEKGEKKGGEKGEGRGKAVTMIPILYYAIIAIVLLVHTEANTNLQAHW